MSAKKILILEDDEALKSNLAEYLGGLGFEVSKAASVAEAYQMLLDEAPHLIILDIYLGKELGLDLTSKIKKTEPELLYRQPRILAISGLVGGDMLKSEASRTSHKIDGFLKKPFTLGELKQKVDTLLTRQ